MKILRSLVLLLGLNSLTSAYAASPADFDFSLVVPQSSYDAIIKPIVLPMRFNFISSAKSTGIMGFELGLGTTLITVPAAAKEQASLYLNEGKNMPKYLPVPRLIAQKGLPYGFDIALNFAMIPAADFKLLGAALQYQFELPVPALPLYLGARVGYSTLLGLKELHASNVNVEGIFSAGMPPGVNFIFDLQPWLGIGGSFVNTKSDMSVELVPGTAVTRSLTGKYQDTYATAGLMLGVTLLHIAAEAQVSLNNLPVTYNLKVGIGL